MFASTASPALPRKVCNICNQSHLSGVACSQEPPHSDNLKKNVSAWDNLTTTQKALTVAGKITAGIMALGCGISTAAAFVALNVVSAGAASFAIAGIIFFAGSAINWYIFKSAVPNVLIDIFGKSRMFEGLLEVKGNCEALTLGYVPQLDKIFDLPFTANAAYILATKVENGSKVESLYYVNKKRKVIEPIILNDAQIKTFKEQIVPNNIPKTLSYERLQLITQITSHHPLSKTRQGLMGLGVITALSVGITFSALTYSSTFTLTAAFGFLTAISAGFPPIAAVLATATLVCLTALMLKDIADLVRTENVWQECKKFAKSLIDISPRSQLIIREAKPTIAELNSLDTETIYIKIGDELYYFKQEKMKEPRQLKIENPAFLAALPKTSGKLTFPDMQAISAATNNQHKVRSLGQTIAIRVVSTLTTIVFIPLAILGLYMTMNACAPGVKAFLLTYIPNASVAAVEAASSAIALGLALLGQVVFTINTLIKTINNAFSASLSNGFFGKKIDVARASYNNEKTLVKKFLATAKIVGLYTVAVINAVGNGLISMVGAGKPGFLLYAAGVGGATNSFSAGADSIAAALNMEEEAEINKVKAHSGNEKKISGDNSTPKKPGNGKGPDDSNNGNGPTGKSNSPSAELQRIGNGQTVDKTAEEEKNNKKSKPSTTTGKTLRKLTEQGTLDYSNSFSSSVDDDDIEEPLLGDELQSDADTLKPKKALTPAELAVQSLVDNVLSNVVHSADNVKPVNSNSAPNLANGS